MGQDQESICPRCEVLPAGAVFSLADSKVRICDLCADSEKFLRTLTGAVNPTSTWPAEVSRLGAR